MDALHRKPECGITHLGLRRLLRRLCAAISMATSAVKTLTDAVGHSFEAINAWKAISIEVCALRLGTLEQRLQGRSARNNGPIRRRGRTLGERVVSLDLNRDLFALALDNALPFVGTTARQRQHRDDARSDDENQNDGQNKNQCTLKHEIILPY